MSYNLVVLGDINVGKTALIIQTYDPTIVISYKKQTIIDGQPCVIYVLETAGQGEHTPLWDQWIRDGEGFLLVYSVSSRSTFEQVERFKNQIVRIKGSNKIPLILVGNKPDEHTEQEVSREEGMNMAKRLSCEFFESSAKTLVNVERPFYTVVQMIRQKSISEEEKWFKNQLKRECILFLDYKYFQNIKIIDGGSFRIISCASSKHHQGLVALKSINIDQKYTFEQLLNEAKQHCKVEFHSNILRFYGITKEKHKKNYMFVLEYANNGNLCDYYLKSNFKIMDWNIKLKFANQIVSAVRHLHENKIVHRDLHSKNILIHNGNIKICDFRISKFLLDPSIEVSKRLGSINYSDPQYLGNIENYIKFTDIMLGIISGEREAIIKGTPRKYAEIYTACWQGNPDLRPHIHQVMQDLDNVDVNNTIEDIVNLTDQTNSDDLLYLLSAQIYNLNNHLKDLDNIDITDIINSTDQTNNELFTELPLSG
ncbi:9301_t:CDS:10 [Entrophospora sp. SA101]|nr:9301_t:CDS:10 [Entrophospora sp. SA101]